MGTHLRVLSEILSISNEYQHDMVYFRPRTLGENNLSIGRVNWTELINKAATPSKPIYGLHLPMLEITIVSFVMTKKFHFGVSPTTLAWFDLS